MPKIAKLLTEKEIKALKIGDHAVGGRGLSNDKFKYPTNDKNSDPGVKLNNC